MLSQVLRDNDPRDQVGNGFRIILVQREKYSLIWCPPSVSTSLTGECQHHERQDWSMSDRFNLFS
jgi:hypothetical protein